MTLVKSTCCSYEGSRFSSRAQTSMWANTNARNNKMKQFLQWKSRSLKKIGKWKENAVDCVFSLLYYLKWRFWIHVGFMLISCSVCDFVCEERSATAWHRRRTATAAKWNSNCIEDSAKHRYLLFHNLEKWIAFEFSFCPQINFI